MGTNINTGSYCRSAKLGRYTLYRLNRQCVSCLQNNINTTHPSLYVIVAVGALVLPRTIVKSNKIRKIGEASADIAATETYYIKGYCDLEETIKVQISKQRRAVRKMLIISGHRCLLHW